MNTLRCVLLSATLCGGHALAAELELPRNGWVEWEVAAVADAPAWCCYGRNHRAANPVCRLDEEQHGFSSQGDAKTDAIRIHVRMLDGKPASILPLSSDCPVETRETVQHLNVTEDTSARWLTALLKQESIKDRLSNDAMAALAAHSTVTAQASLATIARSDQRFKQRKNAVFWLAHVRGTEGAKIASSMLFDDPDPRMRQHAAFAVTQSKAPTVATDLIRSANGDRDTRVRAQSWFWLAQTRAPQTESAINTALETEKNQRVREQAIFALSQLPDERSTPALIAVAENTTLPRSDRKQAVFWLAQDGSDAALAYLDEVVSKAQ